MKKCSLWKRLILVKSMEDCFPWEGIPILEQRKRGVLPLGQRSSRENAWWTDHNPHFCPPVPPGGRRWRIRNKVKPGKYGGVEERCFYFWSHFSLFCSDLIDNRLIFFRSWLSFVHEGNRWSITPWPNFDLWPYSRLFSPLSSWGEVWLNFRGHLASNQDQSTTISFCPYFCVPDLVIVNPMADWKQMVLS